MSLSGVKTITFLISSLLILIMFIILLLICTVALFFTGDEGSVFSVYIHILT